MYQGVKYLISKYREPFDSLNAATKKAKERMKLRGISSSTKEGKIQLQEEIILVQEEWKKKEEYGANAHSKLQHDLKIKYPDTITNSYTKTNFDEISKEDILLINKVKLNTRYTEKHIIDFHNKLSMYIDELHIDDKGYIHITEYKSSKNLNRTYTYKYPLGTITNYYSNPISHIIDCNFSHATLQASMYMYFVWYYNKHLKPGTITIKHIILNEEDGSIISLENHEAPYWINEIKDILQSNKL